MKIFSRRDKKTNRQNLRLNTNDPEKLLWYQLKGRNLLGLKFRRQHSIGSFIVDFYCPKAKLVVEVDGDSHFEKDAERYDKERTLYLNKHGIKVLRFSNLEVRSNINGVIDDILSYLNSLS